MIALLLVAFYSIYFLIFFLVVFWAYKSAKKAGKKPFARTFTAGFIMYNLLFWDLIPTYVMFKYYVHTKSGFWVYKTPEEWKKENPGVAETLTWTKSSPVDVDNGYVFGRRLNERISWRIEERKVKMIPLYIKKETLNDIQKKNVLVERTYISSGYQETMGFLKFWINYRQPIFNVFDFNSLYKKYKNLGREII